MTNTFDANGNVLTVKEGAATITRHYDALNRVTNYVNAAGASIRYTYDAANNLTSLRYPDGKIVTYAYDPHNRLSSVTDWASRVTSFTYDLNGRLTRMDRPNGTRRELSYDAAGQVREIAEKKANGRLIALFRLDYDAGGRPSYEFTVPKPSPWSLPELDATADADNRLATVNGESVIHDPDGNMTAGFLAQGTNAAMLAASFGYDVRNRLTSVSVGSTNVTYAYDAEGHRTGMAVNSVTNTYTINPHAPLSQVLVSETGGALTFYVHGAGLLYEVQPSGAVRYYHYDLRGSTVAMTDESGMVTDRFEYSPYGTMTHREGTTQTAFRFNGAFGVMSDAAGLLCMRARFYNPGLRRFANQDPIGFEGGVNWYAYGNNPINNIDPFGLATMVIIGGPSPPSTENPLGNPFGHASIGFTEGGLYSFGTRNTPPGSSITEFLKRQAEYRDSTVYVLKTTPKQEEAMVAYLKGQVGIPIQKYPDNCANRTASALSAGGIDLTQVVPAAPTVAIPMVMPIDASFPANIASALNLMPDVVKISVPKGTSVAPSFATDFNSSAPNPNPGPDYSLK